MLANNEEYVNNYNSLQAMVQTEVLNLVRTKIEGSPEGKALLDSQLKLVKNLKTSIIEMSQRERCNCLMLLKKLVQRILL